VAKANDPAQMPKRNYQEGENGEQARTYLKAESAFERDWQQPVSKREQ
jgi:hypothetical protein